MQEFVDSIETSLKDKNYHAALFVALSLPDICGKIDELGEQSKARFVQWYDTYVKKYYCKEDGTCTLSGSDCYALRCAFLHEGGDDVGGLRSQDVVEKFEFVVITPVITYHNVASDGGAKLQLNVVDFCKDVVRACNEWLDVIKGANDKQQQLGAMLSIRNLNDEDPYRGGENPPDWRQK